MADNVPLDAIFVFVPELHPYEFQVRDGTVFVGVGTDLDIFKFHLRLSEKDKRFLKRIKVGISGNSNQYTGERD